MLSISMSALTDCTLVTKYMILESLIMTSLCKAKFCFSACQIMGLRVYCYLFFMLPAQAASLFSLIIRPLKYYYLMILSVFSAGKLEDLHFILASEIRLRVLVRL